jgi:hypothetical protein
MTNPFAPAQPAAPVPAGPVNPFAQPAPAAAPAPFAVPVQPAAPAFPTAAAAPVAAPPAFDFSRLASAPAPVVGEGRGAALADMYGRLVLFFPLSLQRVARSAQYITAEQRARGDLDRLNKTGPQQNDPWFLVGATEAEVALVRQYLELVQAGQYPHPLA